MNAERILTGKSYKPFKQNDFRGRYNESVLVDFSPAMFEVTYWQLQAEVQAADSGRGAVWFVRSPHLDLVLRHFRRGGLPGRIFKDTFLNFGTPTRVESEFKILVEAYRQNLPVPECVGYRIHTRGIMCKMDLLMAEIKGSKNFFEILKQPDTEKSVWPAIGVTIKQFHNAGFIHGDLNVHNILIDTNHKIWLIDFDKGRLNCQSAIKKKNNLDRLKRSLLKEQKKHSSISWQESDWASLLEAYER